jgi:hypothetical protein
MAVDKQHQEAFSLVHENFQRLVADLAGRLSDIPFSLDFQQTLNEIALSWTGSLSTHDLSFLKRQDQVRGLGLANLHGFFSEERSALLKWAKVPTHMPEPTIIDMHAESVENRKAGTSMHRATVRFVADQHNLHLMRCFLRVVRVPTSQPEVQQKLPDQDWLIQIDPHGTIYVLNIQHRFNGDRVNCRGSFSVGFSTETARCEKALPASNESL